MNETIHVRPLLDPIIDTLGHDPRSPYPERFWLPTLGPTALALLRLIAYRFDRAEHGFVLDLAETSRCLGLGERDGRNSPIARSLGRLVQFNLAADDSDGVLGVRRHVPPINLRHVRRLPVSLQGEHDAWVGARLADAPLAPARQNARRAAAVLCGLGESPHDVERALSAAGFDPAIARDAALWAWERFRAAETGPLVAVSA